MADSYRATSPHPERLQTLLDKLGDFVGVPASQLAVFPGTTHFNEIARTTMVLDAVTTFLDS